MENITLKHLANQLGLSVATVSRALNDSYEISEETKKKVRKLAKELNYQPNPFASFLKKHKSKTIALIIPDISNNFFSQIIKGVETVSQDLGYHVIICDSHENFDKEKQIIQHLISGRVDGILISSSFETQDDGHLLEIIKRKIPLILFDRVSENLSVSTVVSNDYESSFLATQHLIENNCKKIAFLKVGKNLSITEKRFKGYFDALEKNNIPYDEELVIESSNEESKNINIIHKLITEKKPDAVFATVEHLAISSYDVCKSLNIKIPEELKIISYSNLAVARHLNPSLTTISQPAFEIGIKAAELLIQEINAKIPFDQKEKIIINSSLMVRNSTVI